jgi:hypothetical protein
MSIAAALAYEHQVDQMVQRIEHVASNGIWDPNKLSNPPVQTVTTTGTTHWYDANGNLINGPYWVGDPPVQPLTWPPPQPLPVVTVPNVTMPSLNFEQMLKLVEALQAGALSTKPIEEKKEEEPAKPVEKKYGRVLEP